MAPGIAMLPMLTCYRTQLNPPAPSRDKAFHSTSDQMTRGVPDLFPHFFDFSKTGKKMVHRGFAGSRRRRSPTMGPQGRHW